MCEAPARCTTEPGLWPLFRTAAPGRGGPLPRGPPILLCCPRRLWSSGRPSSAPFVWGDKAPTVRYRRRGAPAGRQGAICAYGKREVTRILQQKKLYPLGTANRPAANTAADELHPPWTGEAFRASYTGRSSGSGSSAVPAFPGSSPSGHIRTASPTQQRHCAGFAPASLFTPLGGTHLYTTYLIGFIIQPSQPLVKTKARPVRICGRGGLCVTLAAAQPSCQLAG